MKNRWKDEVFPAGYRRNMALGFCLDLLAGLAIFAVPYLLIWAYYVLTGNYMVF